MTDGHMDVHPSFRLCSIPPIFLLFLLGCADEAIEQQPAASLPKVAIACSPQQPQPGEDSRIQVKVTRNGEALAGETVTLQVAAIVQGAGEGGGLEELGGWLEERALVTDQQGQAETSFTAGSGGERATITATHLGGSRASCSLEVASPEAVKRSDGEFRLSIACDPLSKLDIAHQKSSTVTVELHGLDGSPVAGKEVYLNIQSVRESTGGRVGGPTAPPPEVGVLGREGQVAGPWVYELMTDDSGKSEIRVPMGSLLGATAITARADDQFAACVWH